MKLAIALGGNALVEKPHRRNYEAQSITAWKASVQLAKILEKGHDLIITHGNGPQVGDLVIQNELAKNEVSKFPLHVCVGMTQGQIGFMFQKYINNELIQRRINKKATTLVTQTVVDENDPRFKRPTKPVGPYYSKETADKLTKEKGETFVPEGNKGWRKVVPSPIPVDIVEKDLIKELFDLSYIVIAAGGGGIPVIKNNEYYKGAEGVIDKDLAGALLAEVIGVDVFLILTNVPHVMLNYGMPGEKRLESVGVEELKNYLEEGHFGEGSMTPKVKAAVQFVENTGNKAIISSLEEVDVALRGEKGTHIMIEKSLVKSPAFFKR